MLACLCCKKGGIGFKEFENAEGDEYSADCSAQGSPAAAAQNGPDVYVLPLTEVSLPMAKQPGRSVQLLKSTDLGRHSLLYLKEIGHGWFGKVFLGEVHSGVSSTQVVVKELKVSASVQEQMQFLEEAQPYRALQHSSLLQCLAQCAEVTPYLLVMEFCPLGDLKGYLRSCRVTESMAPDPLTLQRMACEVACGVLHLHRNNYVHSDLALRNCLLTADLTVKVGDYGLSHCKYREDYFVTADQLWVPLRWIAPELVDEVHGNLLVVDQTKNSNVWSLGVTIWELFELGTQPYPQHSDRQVLAYAVREQQLKLPKPQLQLTLSDRWYEVMQFCWLQPEQRPTAEEVHLLLSYLCAKGATEVEEEFERRWRSLRPGGGSAGSGQGTAGPTLGVAAELAAASSFPLLEQFTGDGFHGDGDDVLTVTETSRGLNFEYKWEAGRGAEAFPPSPGHTTRLQELCALDSAPLGVVPVLSAHSPSLGSEYFIRLEEAAPTAGHDPDCAGCAPSPHAATADQDDDNSDGSASASLAMEPLLGHAAPVGSPWGRRDHHLRRSRDRDSPCPSRSPSPTAEDIDWGEAAFCPPFFEEPLGASPSSCSGALLTEGEEELGEAEAQRATQRGHWSSNMSANNNSASRDPESWDLGYVGSYPDSYMDDSLSPVHTLRASPQLGHPLAQEGPREPLLGPQSVSLSPDSGRRLILPHLGSAQGLAPAPCQVISPCTGAVMSGGDNPQAEPRLAQEAEDSAGLQLFLPSVPSPSHEGAPLPSEDASAPDTLPASPTSAAGSQVTVPELVLTLGSSTSSREVEEPSSEDEDTTEATSGVFTDVSSDGHQAEKPDVVPALRSLQKQVGTPDSLDSLDIPSSASDGGCDISSPSAAGPPGGQPRALDSGYDTENNESPEFVLKEAHEARELAADPGPETQTSASLGGLSEKNPYRDSAYFSDLDAESEPPLGPEKSSPVQSSGQSPGLQSVQTSPMLGALGEAPSAGHREVLPPLLGIQESPPEPGACLSSPRPEPPASLGSAEEQPMPSLGSSKFFLLTPVPRSPEGDGTELQGPPGLSSGWTGNPGTPRAPLCLALPGSPGALEGRPEEEEDDSEDSDESDEELRCYSIQEPSEDSEEESPAVPVVVAESQSARNLRSLLKMPSLLSETFCEDLDRKKKAVSFFDDVTVYLFDQESPTRELGEPFPGVKEAPPVYLPGSPGSSSTPSWPRRSDRSPEDSAMEKVSGGGFEWDNDFLGVPPKGALVTTLGPAAPAPAVTPTPATTAPISRFTVLPAPESRFSISHVSDADAKSVGGPAASAGGEYTEA
ncbi:PREDICTED: serine/threonine-protein kinase LMTK1 isoform X2 [Chinchilla lanigera]|nr:PREDICTED: serine/threonine-protein kinase LMTK1 isoform X2 [Chinchilla lanigera]XP_013361522.1 PREDICTED: serine/threonine-protein kinase LMTK1 isoform X2 [Chinchilla lanigera]XP_013361523.1 PREDICTED: serine/threonine-protein kinase LMTK1 isoform X2 [Chinchilla lanigera]XP_013361525.1 PREDICTED: serine/threonine-protein kinase LMTK1 isoform X2 [Chinchilla lanigera]